MVEKLFCRHCGQPIEFEIEDCPPGSTADCPGCGKQIVLVEPLDETSQSRPASTAARESIPPPQPIMEAVIRPRHGPFYYGCAGALGVFAAIILVLLAIISVGVFPVFQGAFTDARRSAQERAAQNTGAATNAADAKKESNSTAPSLRLTSEEEQLAEQLLTRWVNKDRDDFERVTRYQSHHPLLEGVVLALIFSKDDGKAAQDLRLFISYKGEEWIHLKSLKVRIGDRVYEEPLDNVRTGLAFGKLHEYVIVKAEGVRKLVQELLDAEEASIRLVGDKSSEDYQLFLEDREAFKNLLLICRHFAGIW